MSVSPQGLGLQLDDSPCATSRHTQSRLCRFGLRSIIRRCRTPAPAAAAQTTPLISGQTQVLQKFAHRSGEVRSHHPDCRDCRGDPQRHRAPLPPPMRYLRAFASRHPMWGSIRRKSLVPRPSSLIMFSGLQRACADMRLSVRSVEGCVRSHRLDHAWTWPQFGDRARFESGGFNIARTDTPLSAKQWIRPTGTYHPLHVDHQAKPRMHRRQPYQDD